MPPKNLKIECDLEPYFQYHNRIASFLDWKLDWEINEDKPSPEQLARAGFFSYDKATYNDDNVSCPYCGLTLDSWEPHDDPVLVHQTRSPFCRFVLGQQTVRNMDDAENNAIMITASNATTTNTQTQTQEALANEQNNASQVPRPKRRYMTRATGASRANRLALAGAKEKEVEAPGKRRPRQPRKQPASG
ncbi:hypothetical protein N8I77_005762 [Diaporthe amygdali]|uniref:Uncharacterized protein n=1 Tax=Phomopsis amygdali TaxID=1214568 RepID=A0AAD9SGD3_PHOAM|nr:hypothetical protein N8I77_005762 [Diaporthe amygdali]